MGSTSPEEYKYRNCIKMNSKFSLGTEYNQYDSYGNIVYTYRSISDCCGKGNDKYTVYDVDQRIIGSIESKSNCSSYKTLYSLYDEDNQLLNYFENNDCCMTCYTFTYNFCDANKNLENILIKKEGECSSKYELYDKYNSLISRAEKYCNCDCDFFMYEYDVNNPGKVIKIDLDTFKIYENDNEVDLANKTLFNNGFSKIQMFLILDRVLFYRADSGTNDT